MKNYFILRNLKPGWCLLKLELATVDPTGMMFILSQLMIAKSDKHC